MIPQFDDRTRYAQEICECLPSPRDYAVSTAWPVIGITRMSDHAVATAPVNDFTKPPSYWADKLLEALPEPIIGDDLDRELETFFSSGQGRYGEGLWRQIREGQTTTTSSTVPDTQGVTVADVSAAEEAFEETILEASVADFGPEDDDEYDIEF